MTARKPQAHQRTKATWMIIATSGKRLRLFREQRFSGVNGWRPKAQRAEPNPRQSLQLFEKLACLLAEYGRATLAP